jgi:hypothetical protein
VPTLCVTFGGIVLGAALLFLMQTIETVLRHLRSASRNWEEFPPTVLDPVPRPDRAVARRAIRLHG